MGDNIEKFARMLKESIENTRIDDKKKLLAEKRKISAELGIREMPKNSEILASLKEEERSWLSTSLASKPVRTMSGVSVVALMTKPYDCPHGTCIFCPGGTKINTPQSYTGFEPAARRAAANSYDPYLQIQARLKHYLFLGYHPQKVEVIVIGGTFTTLPKDYREEFMTQIYRAMNDFPISKVGKKSSLHEEKKKNEIAGVRCVALAVETKPERCRAEDINDMIDYGVTRVEIGMQSIYDDVLERNNRGHTIKDVKDATRRLKDRAFKVDYHVMLNMPFSDIDKDRESLKAIWNDEELRPDAIKIYPTLVIKGTALYKMWVAGKHKVYPLDDVINLIAEAEINSPKWLRIMRVDRDIPSNLIEDGVKSTNLRQLVLERIKNMGRKPNDIRSREIGHVELSEDPELRMRREDYRASVGDEIFLSVDDIANDAIVGFLRLRIPNDKSEALVRELHVYGEQKTIDGKIKSGFQHNGVGKALLAEAEKIAANEYSMRSVKVISGVGVREYYRKLGYNLEDNYMVREL